MFFSRTHDDDEEGAEGPENIPISEMSLAESLQTLPDCSLCPSPGIDTGAREDNVGTSSPRMEETQKETPDRDEKMLSAAEEGEADDYDENDDYDEGKYGFPAADEELPVNKKPYKVIKCEQAIRNFLDFLIQKNLKRKQTAQKNKRKAELMDLEERFDSGA